MADPTPPSPAKDDDDASDGGDDEDMLQVDLLATLDDALAYIHQSFPQDDEAGKVRARDAALRVADDILGGDPAGRDLMDDAIEVLQTRTLKRVTARPSGRSFVCVDAAFGGTNGGRYACWTDFCTCEKFGEAAARVSTKVLCKHMLAARLAPLCSKMEAQDIGDDQYHSYISCRYVEL